MLSRRGLHPTLVALARRSPIPVDLHIDLDERPPEHIETAAYYAVSEALANAIKHSNASRITVTIAEDESRGATASDVDGEQAIATLRATVADDGHGGAVPTPGSGLTGLADRIDALGGRFTIDSPRAHGTTISIVLPLRPAPS
jgi:signal transduction histidine kinase